MLDISCPRIICVSDATVEQRQHRNGSGRNVPLNIAEFFSPTIAGLNPDLYIAGDFISPWSPDVQGHWTMLNIPDPTTHHRFKTVGETAVPLDDGLIHEIAHQLYAMQDLYQSNAYENQGHVDSAIDTATTIDSNPPSRTYFQNRMHGGTGKTIVSALSGGEDQSRIEWTWIDAMNSQLLNERYPRRFATKCNQFDGGQHREIKFDVIEGIDLKISARTPDDSKIANINIIPFGKPDLESFTSNKTGEFSLSAERVFTSLFQGFDASNCAVLQISAANGSFYYLPFPTILVNTGFRSALLEDRDSMHFDVEFLEKPLEVEPNDPRDPLFMYFAEDYDLYKTKALMEKDGKRPYAKLSIEHRGTKYVCMYGVDVKLGQKT